MRNGYQLGTAQIIQGNALNLPLPDASVDLVCTSPPYFGLRSYQDTPELCSRCKQLIGQLPPYGNDYHRNLKEAWPDWDAHVAEFHKPTHYEGQIGSEATPAEFLDALIAATAEMVRVLKPSGSIFVNLGDKYAGGGGQWDKDERPDPHSFRTHQSGGVRGKASGGKTWGFKPKSLMGIPWRYAIRCIDQLGLILRAEIIWAKPNGLPESVTDRVRRSHEQWFHLTRSPKIFAAVDEIREPHIHPSNGAVFGGKKAIGGGIGATADRTYGHNTYDELNPLGKLPGSVWTVPTQPLTVPPELGVDHFAAYPMEWPRRLIQGWTPQGICEACGEGRRPVALAEYTDAGGRGNEKWNRVEQGSGDYAFGSFKPQEMRLGRANRSTTITGYTCACPTADAPTRPSVILDPFMGTGTTLVVARALGRNSIGIDLSADYCRLAEWRVNNPGQLAQALQIEKPEPVPVDQLNLFEDML